MFRYIIAWTWCLAASTAQAGYLETPEENCGAVDLRETFSPEIRNQGEISWCYAHAAADYLQFLERLPEPISAADIAIRYAGTDASRVLTFFQRIFSRDARRSPPQTGFLGLAARKIAPEGWCPESALPSSEWTRVETYTGVRRKQEILRSILEVYALQKGVHSGKYRSPAELPAYFEFPQIDQSSFYSILKNQRRSGMLAAIREQACKGLRRPFSAPVQSEFHLKGRRIFERIHEGLDRKEPVSIDFFSGILEDYDQYRRKVSDLHTVLVYGRRFDASSGECHYLIRNSYGTNCSRYDPKIRCEAGYLWFPESKLYRPLTSVVRLRPQR